ncbi:ABC transporter permease [Polycladidibacter hongkongensis]|uniref:ABC transporter permease n=1 Tax=Polycladidibacter hongkongensis TaxID=1647556 RepID=UPI000830A1E1|nr:ABC transporter permease [Pseudovibrio hongkongensis]
MTQAHYVNKAPFPPPKDPREAERLAKLGERSATANFWRRFSRHRVAVICLWVLALFYLSVPFAEFLSPYNPQLRNAEYLYAPPQPLHLFHQGKLIGPFVYPQSAKVNLERLTWEYTQDTDRPVPLRFLCRAGEYQLFGFIDSDLHLFCGQGNAPVFLLGTDRLGRDQLSSLIYGARLSLTIGLLGVSISMLLGIILGGLAGYLGGLVDSAVQRLIEIIRSLPELPLWMALSAALPVTWPPLWIYFGLTIILGLLDWPGLARAVRSKILSLREEDYARAALLMGASRQRIVFRHLLPGFSSHLIASASLAIPAMILGETALSFLNLGLRRPAVSWGVLLNEAQNISVVIIYPWLMAPMVPIILVVLAFNFVGDGLRDAADPNRN